MTRHATIIRMAAVGVTVARITNNCVACHVVYRLDEARS